MYLTLTDDIVALNEYQFVATWKWLSVKVLQTAGAQYIELTAL
jgi:hypothetical protein